jgi:hypothetical protein
MSERPREYEFNIPAATELDLQTKRVTQLLSWLATEIAAKDPQRNPDFDDVVEQKHVLRAADLIVDNAIIHSTSSKRGVFLSHSHQDPFIVSAISSKLADARITFFKADRNIRGSSDWTEEIWKAIRGCRVFASILTPQFIRSRWCHLEGGAACALKKDILPVLFGVDRRDVPEPFNRFQPIAVENSAQLDELVKRLTELCEGTP